MNNENKNVNSEKLIFNTSNGYYLIYKDGCFGLLNNDKEEIIPCNFQKIEPIVKGCFLAMRDNKCLLFDDGHLLDIPPFDSYKFSLFSSILIYADNKTGVYNTQEKKLVVPIEYEDVKYTDSGNFPRTVFLKKDGKWGVFCRESAVTEQLFLISDFLYDDFTFLLTDSYRSLYLFRLSNTYHIGYLNDKKLVFTNETCDDIYRINTHCFLKKNNKWGLIIKDSSSYRFNLASVDFVYDKIQELSNNDIAVCKDNFWGLMNYKGTIISDSMFDVIAGRVYASNTKVTLANINGSWLCYAPKNIPLFQQRNEESLVDGQLFETYFEDIVILDSNIFAYRIKGKWGLAACKPELGREFNFLRDMAIIKDCDYENITKVAENVSDKYYIVLKSDNTSEIIRAHKTSLFKNYKTLYVGDFNKVLINYPFKDINTLVFKLADKYEYQIFDNNFKLISEKRFDELIEINDNYSFYVKHNKYGVIARTGDIIVEDIYDKLFVVGDTICYLNNQGIKQVEAISNTFLKKRYCPKCKRELFLRKNGETNNLYWGCSKYPECFFEIELGKDPEEENDKKKTILELKDYVIYKIVKGNRNFTTGEIVWIEKDTRRFMRHTYNGWIPLHDAYENRYVKFEEAADYELEILKDGTRRVVRYVDKITESIKGINQNKKEFFTEVAGVTYNNSQSRIKSLFIGNELKLVRESQNPYDKNAVAVYSDSGIIGYIPKDLSQTISKYIDEGKSVSCIITHITGSQYETLGVNVRLNVKNVGSEENQKDEEIQNKQDISENSILDNNVNIKNNTNKGKQEGCYIATAVFGSYNAPEVLILRRFRDEIMLNNIFGTIFVKIYYRLSPTFAIWLKDSRLTNLYVRNILNYIIKKIRNLENKSKLF